MAKSNRIGTQRIRRFVRMAEIEAMVVGPAGLDKAIKRVERLQAAAPTFRRRQELGYYRLALIRRRNHP